MKLLLATLTAVLVAGITLQAKNETKPSSGSSEAVWHTDFEKAKELAKSLSRPLLLDFTGSDWCGWCIKLDKEVFSEKSFKSYAAENLVLVELDFPNRKKQSVEEKKQNEALAKKYGIRGYPTILLVDANGKELARTGYQRGGADSYVDHLKELLK
ncbi:MAG: thioredoxin family protein [Verrucomicrobiota bacterium]